MNRLVRIILSGAALTSVLFPVSAYAKSWNSSSSTTITGTINLNGQHVDSGVKVTVACNSTTLNTNTNSLGVYTDTFTSKQCAMDSNVVVTAIINGVTGTNHAKANCGGSTKINVNIVEAIVPEFGTIAEVSAIVISIGSFMLVRRRRLGESR